MNSAPALVPAPAPVDIDWLPGLADVDLGGLVLVSDGSRPIWRHVSLEQASRSQAFVLESRLELKVAPGDYAFALVLIGAFATPVDRPAPAAPASRDLLALAARVASCDISIFIQGATGTGEEGLAHLVHTLPPVRYANAEALLRTLASPALSTQPNSLQSIAELATPASLRLTRQRSAVTSDLATVDIRLAIYRTTLTRQYAAMDRLIAATNVVKEQLDQQIAQWSKRDG